MAGGCRGEFHGVGRDANSLASIDMNRDGPFDRTNVLVLASRV
jgi:hypothetical protein